MKKRIAICMLAVMIVLALAACGGGGTTETATSEKDAYGASRELTLTFDADGNITEVKWRELINGKDKDSSYASELSEADYEAAQDALTKSMKYGETLAETKDIDKVEAVSGATDSYDDMVKLYNEIMEKVK
ncbi:FMN-binding protein [Eubacteriales bacterium OttesenSCG-928-N14]|nr:FMN-binding protein [Eubacteriales bacterium OttesenSCG-928-N14]